MHPVFFEIHDGLPRQGPGHDKFTRRAFSMLEGLPERPRVLDVGCGPGMQTLQLACLTEGPIVAVDTHGPFLDELRARAAAQGFAERIEAQVADMNRLEFADGEFDLIWSEGAIYIMGFEAGLTKWQRLLRPAGCVAVTEAAWLAPDPPQECRRFWDEAYPAMTDVQGNLDIIARCGYVTLGHFVLPESTWWDDYYGPIEERLPAFQRKYANDPEALAVVQEERDEIDFFLKYSKYYGYVFFVMRRAPD